MWTEIILAKNDLENAMTAFCPLRIDLGDGGHVALSSPRDLVLLADVGLSVNAFDLPAALTSARAIAVRASWGRVRITSEALVFAVSFAVNVESLGTGTGSASEPGVETSASDADHTPT